MVQFIILRCIFMYIILIAGEILSVLFTLYLYQYAPIHSIRPIHIDYTLVGMTRVDFFSATYGLLLWNLSSGYPIMALVMPIAQNFMKKKYIIIVMAALQILCFILFSGSGLYITSLVEIGASPSLVAFFLAMGLFPRRFGEKCIRASNRSGNAMRD